MNIGKMNQRITIQQRGSGVDAGGEPSGSWTNVATVWAELMKDQGGESTDDIARVVSRNRTWRIRYRTGLTTDMRILTDSEYYQISDIRTIGLNKHLEVDGFHKSNW